MDEVLHTKENVPPKIIDSSTDLASTPAPPAPTPALPPPQTPRPKPKPKNKPVEQDGSDLDDNLEEFSDGPSTSTKSKRKGKQEDGDELLNYFKKRDVVLDEQGSQMLSVMQGFLAEYKGKN